MEPLGKGFGQAVGQGFRHDGIVVIVVPLELFAQKIDPNSRRHGKGSDVIRAARLFRCDKIRQRETALPLRLLRLLAQGVERRQDRRATVIAVNLNIVSQTVGREKPVHPVGGE